MKKFLLSIAFVLFAGATIAQTVVTTISAEMSYTLECRSGYAHSATRFIGVTDAGVINGQSSTAAYVTFEAGDEAGTYYIKVGEKYINCDASFNLSASIEKSTAWVLGTVGETVTFKVPNSTRYLNNNGTACTDGTITGLQANNHSSGPNASNACSTWQMKEYNLNSNEAAVATLDAAIAKAENMSKYIGAGVGKYTYKGEGNYEEKYAAIVAYREAIVSTTTPSSAEVAAKTEELNALITAFEINQPEKGKYYRFKGHGTDNYMLSDVYATDTKYLAMGSGELASAIFYYGEDGSLLSYANGRYLSDAARNSSDWTCLAVGTVGSAATFAAGKTFGEYGFYVGDNSTRAYYSGRGTYVDAGGNIAANNGYDWIIEEVTTLPVTVTEAGYATFFAPVEVTVPAGDVTAHTVTVDGEWASLSEALTTIPANTGVVLANAGTVELAINYAGTTAAIEGNVLAGTAAKSIISIENGSYYVLAKPEGAEVAGLYTPKNGDDKTTFINGSHKAYMHLAAQGAAYYSFRFPGTTGIEEVTTENGNVKAIYDLTGRRVEAITAPGIYIVNGKKTLVK